MRIACLAALLSLAPAFAQQGVPEIPFESVADFFKLPDGLNFGEVPGVAVNSHGHIFVFTRSNTAGGPAYGPAAAQFLEFGPNGEFLREIGKGLYGWSEAHTVRVDRNDNIWAIDKGSDMVIQFNPAGQSARRVRPQEGIGGRGRQSLGASEPAARACRWALSPTHRRRLGFGGQHLHHRRIH